MTFGQCRRRSQSVSIAEALPCEGLWYVGTIPPIRTALGLEQTCYEREIAKTGC
jgi:hypothetical protein